MLAIIEKWKPFTHGYTSPPDNHYSINIMKNLYFILIRWEHNEHTDPIGFLNEYVECISTLTTNFNTSNHPHRDFNIVILKGQFRYKDRDFAIVNQSFLKFICKCKNYYKNKLLHYKNIHNLLHRNIYGRFPSYTPAFY